MELMRELDDMLLKKEIDEITKRIDAIVENIDHMEPDSQKPDENRDQAM
jgi:hypothetical protein